MARLIYTLLIYLLTPVALIKLCWRGIKQPAYLRHIPERFGFYPAHLPKQVIWLHAVSVGETRATIPLVAALKQQYPNTPILITHGTPTGRETSQQLYGDGVTRAYLPYDTPGAMRRFLMHFEPIMGLVMETELWFNLIHLCQQRSLPLALVNARLSEKSCRGYLKLGACAREGLQSLRLIAAQTEADAQRLRLLGAHQVHIMGNLKFDVTPPVDAADKGAALRQLFGQPRPVFLLASSRDGEEALILNMLATMEIPDLLTIIVPRHPQRFDEVAKLIEATGQSYQRRSEIHSTLASTCNIVLGDSMGEMFSYYAACDIALIGGSLLPFGGQNLIEACGMGKPVLIGQHTFNFAEVSENAIAAGAAIRLANPEALPATLTQLFASPKQRETMAQAARAFSLEHRGATDRLMQLIKPLC